MQSNVELLTSESTICHPLDRRATLDLENYVAIISLREISEFWT